MKYILVYHKNKIPTSSSHIILLTINLLHLKNELQLPPAITIWTQKNGSWKHYISLIIFQPKPLSDICSSCQKSSSQKEESISFQFSILSCTLGWIFQKNHVHTFWLLSTHELVHFQDVKDVTFLYTF